jgi:hypothetical protein
LTPITCFARRLGKPQLHAKLGLGFTDVFDVIIGGRKILVAVLKTNFGCHIEGDQASELVNTNRVAGASLNFLMKSWVLMPEKFQLPQRRNNSRVPERNGTRLHRTLLRELVPQDKSTNR